jgi:hypothetical protein
MGHFLDRENIMVFHTQQCHVVVYFASVESFFYLLMLFLATSVVVTRGYQPLRLLFRHFP